MNANEITFGIEIECLMPVSVLRSEGWEIGGYHHGRPVPNATNWNAQSDGSIRNNGNYEVQGVEVVSGILKGEAGIEEVKAMVARLVASGAKVNESCGFHVHVGVDIQDAASMARLVCLVANFEKALYAITGTRSREQGTYCKSVKVNGKYRTVGNTGKVTQGYRSVIGDRYHILNLENVASGRAPAVEFRVFSGTLNVTKILAYIQLAVGMVQKAAESKARTSWESKAKSYSQEGKKTEGVAECNRLLAGLGWVQNQKNTKYGVMVNQETLEAMRVKLRELAAKYDAAGQVEEVA